ncbi:MAG: penicillin-binding protein activator LpoB [gamma proteobacterium symbiont of Taylorina sp.]|nr:penicillin-binding protein activator LpoB [gamma proteobacterium symbiont of Taylorina sp.]
MNIAKKAILLSILGSTIAVTGCQSIPMGQQSDVAMVDAKGRGHLQAQLTMADYVALAEKVTNKMLVSKLVQRWGKKKPKVIAATPVNNTDNENVRMSDLHDRIQETLFNSGVMRVVDKSATSFDYVIKSELTSTRQYGKGGKELVHYTLQLKMFTLMGELKGQWSDDLAMAKSEKSMF